MSHSGAADLTPVLAEQLQSVLQRFDALDGILVSTVEGVPLLKATSLTDTDAVTGGNDFVETVLPTVFAGVAEQVSAWRPIGSSVCVLFRLLIAW
ncbi:hypothetical protein ATCC90586_011896 [Pythium insidiosum]|nr:hypothetical protein ATCC90586_011896 [Pythium insidiosum]